MEILIIVYIASIIISAGFFNENFSMLYDITKSIIKAPFHLPILVIAGLITILCPVLNSIISVFYLQELKEKF